MSKKAYPEYKPSGVEWLGEIPECWRTIRVKYVSSINDDTISETTEPDYDLLYVDIGSVDSSAGIQKKEPMQFENAPSRARRKVRSGDVIVSTVRTYLRAISPISEPEDNLIVSTGFAVVRPQDGLTGGFAAHMLRAPYFVDEVVARSVGVSYPAINASEIGNLFVAIPPLDDQRAISAFLDRETERVDGLIGKKQRQIKLLEEKRAALISHAVTKGLDPKAKMKPSGIEWLGEIPEHWKVIKLRRLTLSRCDGPFGSGLKSEHYRDDGIRVIRLQNIRFAHFDDTDQAFIDPDYYQELGDHDIQPGDLLIAGLGDDKNPVGRACVAPHSVGPAMVKADCFRFRLDQGIAAPAYFAFQLSTAAAALDGALATGTTRARMNLSYTGDRAIILPPLEEQRAIATFLYRETGRIDTLIEKVEKSIDKLREYRTALISAAVTGKMDVRGEVA